MIRVFLSACITIWLALTVVFFGLRWLPGNAIEAQLAGSGLPPAVIQDRLRASGLDQSPLRQYMHYWRDLLRGDLGQSLYTGQTVNEILAARWPVTAALAGHAVFWMFVLALILGFAAGLMKPPISQFARLLIDLSLAIPIYITLTFGLLFIASSRTQLELPALILGYHTAGAVARLIETRLRDLQGAPYIQAARGKGLSERHIIQRHMLRLALLPAIPVIALQAGILFSGAVLTEIIFGFSGLGVVLLDAILQRNYPVIQGVVLLIVITIIALNTMADFLQRAFDPRLTLA